MKTSFYIEQRFLVNPILNTVTDSMTKADSRIEPRFMSLLCLLADNAGELVSREWLIKEIWNDYGGADEGLNQAVSFLRKLLQDNNKKIIETIPKKGYRLTGSVSFDPAQQKNPERTPAAAKQPLKKNMIFGGIVLLLALLVCLWLIFRTKEAEPPGSPDLVNQPSSEGKDSGGEVVHGSDVRPVTKTKADSSATQ